MRKLLTDKLLQDTTVEKGSVHIFDTQVSGLYARLFPRSRVFMLKTRASGKQVYHNLGTYPETSIAAARTKAIDLLAVAPPAAKKHGGITLQEALTSFLISRKFDLKPRTLEDFEYYIGKYCAAYLDTPVHAFTTALVDKISSDIVSQKSSRGESRVTTRNSVVRYLRALINFAIRKHSLHMTNPLSRPGKDLLTPTRVRRVPTLYNSLSAISLTAQALLQINHNSEKPASRDLAALALFLLTTGIRHGDAINLTYGDIFPDGTYVLRDTKNRNDYLLPLPAPFDYLRQWGVTADAPPDAIETIRNTRVFPRKDLRETLQKVHRTVLSKAGPGWDLHSVTPLRPHDFRRLFTSVASTLILDSDIIDALTCRAPKGVKAQHYMRDIDTGEKTRLLGLVTDRILDVSDDSHMGRDFDTLYYSTSFISLEAPYLHFLNLM